LNEFIPPQPEAEKPKKNYLHVILPFAFAFAIIIGVVMGIYINQATGGKVMGAGKGDEYSKLREILGLVKDRYVDTLNTQQMEEQVINSWLSHLDPHSVYISAEEMTSVNEDMQGNFDGIGIEFHIDNDTIIVVTPIVGGPSESVGIKSGDKIISINDTVVAGKHIVNNDVMHKLRGEKGTKVKLGIKRPGESKLLTFTVKRDKIPLVSVDVAYMVDDQIAYIKVNRFSATTTDELGKQLYEMKQKGMKKLILDLRQNPGGYLNAAVDISDEFLEGKKLVVYTKGNSSPRQDYVASKPGQFEEGDLCVLIDEGSASASEILAGALQDHDRATIIGRRSFGKGLVQDQFPLSDGSALRLTIARYYTPSGRCIQRAYGNGTDAYYNELMERYDNGEFFSADSIRQKDTVVYHTDAGRAVYAGGGITPDVFVGVDTSYNWTFINKVRRLIPDFVYENYPGNSSLLAGFKDAASYDKGFVVSDALLQELYAFERKKEPDMLWNPKAKDNQVIAAYLKGTIGRQKWQSQGFYPEINAVDETFNAALGKLRAGKK
jgi:carboxyl-terminal processing protease